MRGSLYKALHELQRLQAARDGQAVPLSVTSWVVDGQASALGDVLEVVGRTPVYVVGTEMYPRRTKISHSSWCYTVRRLVIRVDVNPILQGGVPPINKCLSQQRNCL